MPVQIAVDQKQIAAFCERHHIVRLALFGSVLGTDFNEASDVDVLVDYDPAHVPDLFAVLDQQAELSLLLGRKADMRTRKGISRFFRDDVVRVAEVLYAA